MKWWRVLLDRLAALVRRRRPVPPAEPEPAPEPALLQPLPPVFVPPDHVGVLIPHGQIPADLSAGTPAALLPNRATRRALSAERRQLERARLKFDKFVIPQGERPAAHAKPTSKSVLPGPTSEQPASDETRVTIVDPRMVVVDNGSDFYVVDKHHSDRQTEVLYEPDELAGEFNFRDTIMEQLERYFVYLDRMKRMDPDAYDFYREVGATLLPYAAIPDNWVSKRDILEPEKPIEQKQLSPWFVKTMPSFGCVSYGANPES